MLPSELLQIALHLLTDAKRCTYELPSGFCQFDYVNLKDDLEEHQSLLVLIRQVANEYGLQYKHARLSRYRAGDFCNNHVDTIPHAVFAGVIRLNGGDPLLCVHHRGVDYSHSELPGQVIVFNPKDPHEVLKVPERQERIVLNFWLVSQS